MKFTCNFDFHLIVHHIFHHTFHLTISPHFSPHFSLHFPILQVSMHFPYPFPLAECVPRPRELPERSQRHEGQDSQSEPALSLACRRPARCRQPLVSRRLPAGGCRTAAAGGRPQAASRWPSSGCRVMVGIMLLKTYLGVLQIQPKLNVPIHDSGIERVLTTIKKQPLALAQWMCAELDFLMHLQHLGIVGKMQS